MTIDTQQFLLESTPYLKHYLLDFAFKSTGILIEDPEADGRIVKELEKEKLDLQKINELFWD